MPSGKSGLFGSPTASFQASVAGKATASETSPARVTGGRRPWVWLLRVSLFVDPGNEIHDRLKFDLSIQKLRHGLQRFVDNFKEGLDDGDSHIEEACPAST